MVLISLGGHEKIKMKLQSFILTGNDLTGAFWWVKSDDQERFLECRTVTEDDLDNAFDLILIERGELISNV